MSKIKKIIENKMLLVGLIIFLLFISIAQSVFLIKLYRSVNQDSPVEITRDLGKDFGLQDDFFKHFDDQTWNPLEEFKDMRERMDRIFDDSFNRFRLSPSFDEDRKETFVPQTDLMEEDDRYIVKMNLPGSDKAEIKVDIDGETLRVKAKTQTAKGNKNGDSFLRMERSVGSFQRAIQLPGPVEAGGMKTEYEDGVLTVILPKKIS